MLIKSEKEQNFLTIITVGAKSCYYSEFCILNTYK